MTYRLSSAALALILSMGHLWAQDYGVRAVEAQSGKPLQGIPITLRYDCTATGSGIETKIHCKFIQRRTGADGIAHFPKAASVKEIDDIYSLPITYGMVCCDISHPKIPGIDTMSFKRRSFGEMLHWILVGD